MRALRAGDPREVGGHRLLARLGAGGMGVVYLARTGGGAMVALKVIRAEHAADETFRARFRREAEVAAGLRGRWLVPVVDADADADEPWLAAPYVPGPALSEAVDVYGALPENSVRLLGARLAAALVDVHETGLVHRDVKPGNVLLALDGPRLIDFGIARPTGPSVLTSSDAVIGTPGFLSPEQTRATGDEVGPAADVFCLGCVLAFAASGRRPFGTGNVAGILFRIVHEQPDLTGLPAGLREVIASCLAKEPGERPAATDVRDALVPGPDTGGQEWLPSAVLRLVAERSAAALDPPPPDPGPAPPSAPEATGTRLPRRRGLLVAGAAAAATLVAGGVTAYVTTRSGGGTADGTGAQPRQRPVLTLGFHADLTGRSSADGRAQERGARLAVVDHNSRGESRFDLALKTFDDAGDPQRAEETARRVIADSSVRAVVGPTTAAAARAAGPLYEEARTAMVLVSVAGLSQAELANLCITRASDGMLVTPLLDYLTRVRHATRTAVIDDREAGAAGWDWTTGFRENPPGEGTTTVHTVAAGADDFEGAVREALTTRPDAVVYSGVSPRRAALCAKALAGARFTGTRTGFWQVMTPAFLREAGAAAEGWVLSAPFTDPQAAPGPAAAFRKAHVERYKEPPGRWAAEAYDAIGLLADTMDALGGTAAVRPAAVTRRVFTTSHQGVAKPLRFVPGDTHLLDYTDAVFLYRADGGDYRFLGPVGDVTAQDSTSPSGTSP
ncbi:bifunctional serine/threonine-protein kinase/ABC transporter substrate-binding protein [Streptomyces sp. NPDC127039]|uniref:bifunctional serine/threonine-protein kinase/ABC transporter substrate-binding protein n=1 Tax=Streptomyces sp. NPDC127039 TaxID=3347115 RepID=UPI003663EF67